MGARAPRVDARSPRIGLLRASGSSVLGLGFEFLALLTWLASLAPSPAATEGIPFEHAWPEPHVELRRVSFARVANEVGEVIGKVSGDAIRIRMDVPRKHGRIALDAGNSTAGIRVAADVQIRNRMALIKSSVDFAVDGSTLRFELPTIAAMSQHYLEDRITVVVFPMAEGTW